MAINPVKAPRIGLRSTTKPNRDVSHELRNVRMGPRMTGTIGANQGNFSLMPGQNLLITSTAPITNTVLIKAAINSPNHAGTIKLPPFLPFGCGICFQTQCVVKLINKIEKRPEENTSGEKANSKNNGDPVPLRHERLSRYFTKSELVKAPGLCSLIIFTISRPLYPLRWRTDPLTNDARLTPP